MDPKERLIFALDVDHFEEAQRLVLDLKEHVGMFKVGKQLFTHCGPKIIDFIKLKNSKVFLDLKYHDIPNTVSKAAIEAAKLGVDMLNIHSMGGLTMMRETKTALHNAVKTLGIQRPKLIAVTVLTSLDNAELEKMGIPVTVDVLTKNLTLLAKEADIDGVVAGGSEIELIRTLVGKDFIVVTPGVRVGEKKDDQKRTIGPVEAIQRGATYIVLGRAIRDNPDPGIVLEKMCREIANAGAPGQK
jgi:orotidine-5'-phosphate decarboxylase